MLKIENRESANLKSRVKDLSVVPNIVSYTGLFACITPLSKIQMNSDNLYEPILIRDVETLINTFGDPRIDPEKYCDLYSIMQIVSSGSSCYVTKVKSGDTGEYEIKLCKEIIIKHTDTLTWTINSNVYTKNFGRTPIDINSFVVYEKNGDNYTELPIDQDPVEGTPAAGKCLVTIVKNETNGEHTVSITLHEALANGHTLHVDANIEYDVLAYNLRAYSSLTEAININCKVIQAKPLSLGLYYLVVDVIRDDNTLATAKVKLADNLTNQGLVDALNSFLRAYITLDLADITHKGACATNSDSKYSIVKTILDIYAPFLGDPPVRKQIADSRGIEIQNASTETNEPNFIVSINDYIDALTQYKDKKYTGCLMADFTAPCNHIVDLRLSDKTDKTSENYKKSFGAPTPTERRTLHYFMKQIACERKDTNVILSVPLFEYVKKDINDELTAYDDISILSLDNICDWVAATGSYSDLWEYGQINTTDYSEQSFYLEIYYSWLNMNCVYLKNGVAMSFQRVQVAPANAVAQNILSSYRNVGPHLPVAGDQYGALPSSYSVIINPKTKADRDQLVQYRINPIYDTGTRGVQIYGNETLNAGYTDLNAAHIARELVNLRSRIDEYTETLKFMLNNAVLWDTWKAYVSSKILEPAKSINAIRSYSVAMGYDTTTPEEMANRMVKGQVSLQFYQSAEIFDLTFTIFSTSAEELG